MESRTIDVISAGWQHDGMSVTGRRLWLTLGVCVLILSAATAAAVSFLIVPGRSFGPIREGTTRTEQERIFGRSALVDELVPYTAEINNGTRVYKRFDNWSGSTRNRSHLRALAGSTGARWVGEKQAGLSGWNFPRNTIWCRTRPSVTGS